MEKLVVQLVSSSFATESPASSYSYSAVGIRVLRGSTSTFCSRKGNLIEIDATKLLHIKETKGGPILSWKIHKLKITPSLTDQRDQAKALIHEAFTAMGETHKSDEIFAVNLDFPDSI